MTTVVAVVSVCVLRLRRAIGLRARKLESDELATLTAPQKYRREEAARPPLGWRLICTIRATRIVE